MGNGQYDAGDVEQVESDIIALFPADGDGLVTVTMDTYDWTFVIETLRYRERQSTGDTKERLTFTADSIQDVLNAQ